MNPVLSFRSIVPKYKYKQKTSIRKTKDNSSGFSPDRFELVTIKAIEDLITFCNHFIKLIGKECVFSKGLSDYINEVIKVMNEVIKSINGEKITVGSASIDDNEEISMIEDVLDNPWFPEIYDDENCEFVESLIQFWLDEIKDRGYTIHGLLIGSEDFYNAELAFRSLEHLNYPPRYGQG